MSEMQIKEPRPGYRCETGENHHRGEGVYPPAEFQVSSDGKSWTHCCPSCLLRQQTEITDDLVEGLAERLYEIEFTAWSETASPDNNRWSWRGDDVYESIREAFREQARVAVAYINEHTGKG